MQKRMRWGIAFILVLNMAASLGGISSLAASSGTTTDSEKVTVPFSGAAATFSAAFTPSSGQATAAGYPLTDTSGKPGAGKTVTVSGYNDMTLALANTYTDSPLTGDLPEIIDIEETLPPLDPSPTPSAAPAPVPSAPVQIPEDPPKGPAPVVTIEDPDLPLADAPATGESLLLYFLITLLLASSSGLVWIVLREYREHLIRRKK